MRVESLNVGTVTGRGGELGEYEKDEDHCSTHSGCSSLADSKRQITANAASATDVIEQQRHV